MAMRAIPFITAVTAIAVAAGCASVQPSSPASTTRSAPATASAPSAPTPTGTTPVTISFAVTANDQPVSCGTPLGALGLDRTPSRLRDARFYVQDVSLIDNAGRSVPVALDTSEWQNGLVALLDFEDGSEGCKGGTPETNHQVIGRVPAGTYTGLSFTVGVPPQLNHTSTELEAAPLDIAGMSWAWQVGRRFARIEILPDGGVARPNGANAAAWFIHLGSSACSGNPVIGETVTCERSNRAPVRFERFDVAADTVVLDLATLFDGSRISEDRGGAVGCMSAPTDPECAPVFERLGISLADGGPATSGSTSAFRVRVTP